jgi:hypothetical protein
MQNLPMALTAPFQKEAMGELRRPLVAAAVAAQTRLVSLNMLVEMAELLGETAQAAGAAGRLALI